MAFYEGIDEEIYEGGDHYVPMAKFRLNQNYTPKTIAPEVMPTSTSYGIPTLYPYSRDGDGGYQGGGKWGNLDLSKSKTFTKDVWGEFGPGKGGWKSKEVTGFLNPQTGQYQTLEGKNINHLGIEVPSIAGALFDKGFGKGPQIGDIKGTFTDGWDSGWENIKEGWEEEKDKWSGILGIDQAKAFFKGKKENKWGDITDIDSQENQSGGEGSNIITNTDQTGKGDGDGPGSWGGHGSVEAYDKAHEATYERAKSRHDWADGGRIYLNLGGLASMLGREGFKKGGRQDQMGGTMEQTAQELRDAAPDQFGGGMTIGHGGGDNQNNNNTVTVPTNNYMDVNPELLREDPHVNINLNSPLNIAKLKARLGLNDIFDNDDLYAEGDFTTNIGPVTTNTKFTDDGIGNTDINWGNFSTTIDPNKNIQNIGYNNSYNGINYGVNYADGNTMFNIGTTFKNGGLARLL